MSDSSRSGFKSLYNRIRHPRSYKSHDSSSGDRNSSQPKTVRTGAYIATRSDRSTGDRPRTSYGPMGVAATRDALAGTNATTHTVPCEEDADRRRREAALSPGLLAGAASVGEDQLSTTPAGTEDCTDKGDSYNHGDTHNAEATYGIGHYGININHPTTCSGVGVGSHHDFSLEGHHDYSGGGGGGVYSGGHSSHHGGGHDSGSHSGGGFDGGGGGF
ncbi:uncharacterized protein L199_000477 [Kwoniella botswanensis]|uniref:uncharacterized protein n=1 Tax=Kwoniella botswanensis TaxID=1268659 RepID=UPI00315D9044